MQRQSASSRPLRLRARLKGAPAVLVAGAGFCLSLGWAWFPGLFNLLRADLPGLLDGSLFSGGGVSLFFIALGGGFILVSLFSLLPCPAGCLPAARRFRPGAGLHAASLACVGVSLLVRESAPGLAVTLLGLAVAVSGVWWAARLLGLGPLRAALALALAALLAGLLSVWGDLLPAASCLWLPGGLALALLLGQAPRLVTKARFQADNVGTTSFVAPGILLAAAFFTLGLVASAQPGSPGGQVPLELGIALAAGGLALAGRQLPLAPLAAAAAGLAAAVAAVFWGNAAWPAGLAEGAAQGAAVSALAVVWQEQGQQPGPSSRAGRTGLVLALALLLVNGGGMAGTALGLGARPGIGLLAAAGLVLGVAALAAVLALRGDGQEAEQTLWPGLTPRENTVAAMVAQGLSNPAICEKLYVSDNTVRSHLKRLYQKTGAANRAELEQLLSLRLGRADD